MRRALLSASRFVGASSFGLTLLACAPEATPIAREPPAPVVEYLSHQEILTPLPLRVSLPSRYGAEHVLAFVRLWGARGWFGFELARRGQTWAGEVSCRAVSTVTGDTRYFILALDGQGRTVVGSGTPGWPHVATIVGELPDGPRALPGEPRPVRCHDPADCPPDFPGCPAYAFLRPRCGVDDECPGSARCAWDGYCDAAAPTADEGTSDEERLATAVRKATRRVTASSSGPVRR